MYQAKQASEYDGETHHDCKFPQFPIITRNIQNRYYIVEIGLQGNEYGMKRS